MYANNKILQAQIKVLTDQLDYADKINTAVSASSVGWHIDHSLLVINRIITALEQSDPANYSAQFNFKRFLIFTLNHIPRGSARAPKMVIPVKPFDTTETKAVIDSVKQSINHLDQLNPNCYFPHPYFGNLNLHRSRKMLWLHTRHHLNIIRDIIAN